jgi:hypothetical protein
MPRTAATARPLPDTGEWGHLHCSFCGKDGNHVRFLAGGVAGGKICDVCCLKGLVIFVKCYLTPRHWSRAR